MTTPTDDRKRFGVIGVAGYIARRHLEAIKDVGGDLKVACDISDSVGQMDASFPDVRFFIDFKEFAAHVHRLRSQGNGLDYISICSPNFLHRPHVEFALRAGSNAICEKPLVLETADVDALEKLEIETGRNISTILQLRLNKDNIALRDELAGSTARHVVDLTYVTQRGPWYYTSWKGDETKSGGIVTNIGIHLFDLVGFLFGPLRKSIVHHRAMDCAAGVLEHERATVRWFLSINKRDLAASLDDLTAYRRLTIGERIYNLSGDFRDLHRKSYSEILAGRNFPLAEVRPAIAVVAAIRHAPIDLGQGTPHPYLEGVLRNRERYRDGLPV
jgi:UDP-N-acetyl-2-amino-2-deoxyglucuronate dehydrogenase